MDQQTHVIVGGGLAAAKAAETLRSEGFDGAVVLVTAEDHLPYERPPLSKGYLQGNDALDTVFVHDDAFYDDNRIEVRKGVRATGLDTTDSSVTLDGGEQLHFDRLLLATGSEPRRLPVPGGDLDGVHMLRTIEDSTSMLQAFSAAERVAIVGAGWIGCEVAAAARGHGLDVTLIDPADTPLYGSMGPEVGKVYAELHASKGVDLHMGTKVTGLVGDGRVSGVETDTAGRIDADLVVVGIGVTPRVELAEQAGLTVERGVQVDEFLRSSHESVFAAGDIASAWHPLFEQRIRVEHWANAQNQGVTAARNMLGGSEPYDRVPYFFSDQYDLGMEYSGDSRGYDRVVFRGEPASGEFLAFWLRGGVVLAAMNANIWDVTDDLQALVRSRSPVDADRLADAGQPLADLAGSST